MACQQHVLGQRNALWQEQRSCAACPCPHALAPACDPIPSSLIYWPRHPQSGQTQQQQQQQQEAAKPVAWLTEPPLSASSPASQVLPSTVGSFGPTQPHRGLLHGQSEYHPKKTFKRSQAAGYQACLQTPDCSMLACMPRQRRAVVSMANLSLGGTVKAYGSGKNDVDAAGTVLGQSRAGASRTPAAAAAAAAAAQFSILRPAQGAQQLGMALIGSVCTLCHSTDAAHAAPNQDSQHVPCCRSSVSSFCILAWWQLISYLPRAPVHYLHVQVT